MDYMFLIYSKEDERARMQPAERDALIAAHWAVIDDATRKGIFRGAAPLRPTATATTVRVENGKTLTTDGPYAETKEQLAGYYILACKDLDEAIGWAAEIPTVCAGGFGCVEIRPVQEIPARIEAVQQHHV